MLNKLYAALIHYPCLGKDGQIISTAITNIDIHDIARTCRTYHLKRYYMVTNLPAQQQIVLRVLRFWLQGAGRPHNPNRSDALEIVSLKPYLEDTLEEIRRAEGQEPLLVFTSAKSGPGITTYEQMRESIVSETRPILLLFGTGWGLPPEILSLCDVRLGPVRENASFNHLSVRSAIAIILDRLIGEQVTKE